MGDDKEDGWREEGLRLPLLVSEKEKAVTDKEKAVMMAKSFCSNTQF